MRNLNKPNRYNVASIQAQKTLGGDVMQSDENGQYVEWRDYKWLLAEVERLNAVSTIEQRTIQGLQQTPEWSEIARLTADYRKLEADLRNCRTAIRVKDEEKDRLKAELAKSEEHNAALCERLQDLNGEVHNASCINARLHSQFANSEQENARLKAMDSLKTVSLTDSTNWQAIGDYAETKEENARLKAENERLRASSFVTAVPVEQYERLRKAGDELERVLISRSGSYEAGNASHEWNAAKDGKLGKTKNSNH